MKAKRLSYVLPLVLSALAVSGCDTGTTTTDTNEPAPTHEHNYQYVEKVDATCTIVGMKAHYTCDGCDKLFDAEKAETTVESLAIDKVAHTTVKQDGQAATCTVDGWGDYYKCSVCNGYFSDEAGTSVISNLDAWKAGAGKVAKKGHTIGKVNGQAATCTVDGWKDYYECSVCSALFEDQAGAKPINDLADWKAGDGKLAAHHTLEKQNGQAATCTAEGWKDYYECSVVGCGALFEDEAAAKPIEDLELWKSGSGKIDKAAHTTVKQNGQAPTCTEDGWNDYYKCSVCNGYFSDEAGNSVISNLEAWKTGDGKKEKTGHTIKIVNGQAPTCTEDGWNDYFECSVCNGYFSDEAGSSVISNLEAWKTGDGKKEKTGHNFAAAWSTDGTKHWHACQNAGCTAKDSEAAHDMQAQSSSENFKYDAKTTWEECSVCGYKVNEATNEAPWKKVDLDKFKLIETATTTNNAGHTPIRNIDQNGVSYTGYYNGGLQATIGEESVGRNILSITLAPGAWRWTGPSIYFRVYKNNDFSNSINKITHLYYDASKPTEGSLGWIKNGGKIFNANGEPVTEITIGDFYTFEMDFTEELDGGNITAVFVGSAYSDKDPSGDKFENVPTTTIKDLTFKESYCGHPLSVYEQKSVQKTSEFDATQTYDECTVCGAELHRKDICPVGKKVINLNDYSSKTGIFEVADDGTRLIADQEGGTTTSLIDYDIPLRFTGKGKLVVTLRVNATFNGFDVRLMDGNNAKVTDFGQVAIKSNGTPLNNGQEGVTAVLEDDGSTTYEGVPLVNRYITYTFDLSVINTAKKVRFSLWYGHQYIQFKDFYFMDNCDHAGCGTTNVVLEKGEYVDAGTSVYCNKCGQMINNEPGEAADKKKVALPGAITLGNKSGFEVYFENILEHTSGRNKLVVKMRLESFVENEWKFLQDYELYIHALGVGRNELPIGMYEAGKSDQTTKFQINSGTGKDARKLSANANTAAADCSYTMPQYITGSIDSDKIITLTIDMSDPLMQTLGGLAFRCPTAGSRLHIFDAYQTK